MSYPPSPQRVIEYMMGGWIASVLGAAARHGVFAALEGIPDNAAGLAKKIDVSVRGAQALLDGCTGLGLLAISNGKYENTPEATAYLVPGKQGYLGDLAECFLEDFPTRHQLPDAVKTGLPVSEFTPDDADNPFWHMLVPALAPLSVPVINLVAERVGIAKAGRISWLDVGGGSGIWSAVWLGMNKQATGFQLDWPVVNAIGREFVAGFGVADRFNTIDGDYHTTDFGKAKYDIAIYAHIAHYEEAAENVTIFRRLRDALRPSGTLVVNDFILDDQRKGQLWPMLFSTHMLGTSRTGSAHRQADYKAWLTEAGFTSIELVSSPTPATAVLAR
jgi:hypothetical protein